MTSYGGVISAEASQHVILSYLIVTIVIAIVTMVIAIEMELDVNTREKGQRSNGLLSVVVIVRHGDYVVVWSGGS